MLQGAFYMLIIGYIISAFVLTIEINAVNIKKLCRKLRCKKCERFCEKYTCARLKHDLATCWTDMFVDPMKELLDTDDIDTNGIKMKRKELIDNLETFTNEDIDHDYHFPYLE